MAGTSAAEHTNAQGQFRLTGIPVGHYELWIDALDPADSVNRGAYEEGVAHNLLDL